MIESIFNQLFQSKFEAEFYLDATKLIKSATNLIEKFEFDQKVQLFQLNSSFLIKIDFFDLLINFKVNFFIF